MVAGGFALGYPYVIGFAAVVGCAGPPGTGRDQTYPGVAVELLHVVVGLTVSPIGAAVM